MGDDLKRRLQEEQCRRLELEEQAESARESARELAELEEVRLEEYQIRLEEAHLEAARRQEQCRIGTSSWRQYSQDIRRFLKCEGGDPEEICLDEPGVRGAHMQAIHRSGFSDRQQFM